MHELQISIIRPDARTEPAVLRCRRMLNLGYTTRDTAVMDDHLRELEKEGIVAPRPEEPPLIIPITVSALCTAGFADVQAAYTSGEVELVIAMTADGRNVLGVGSDHTDRHLERTNIGWSKQVAPNMLSPIFWDLRDLPYGLDGITMSSWVRADHGDWRLYQEAAANKLWPPAKLAERTAQRMGLSTEELLQDTILMSGTLPAAEGALAYDPWWRVELREEKTGRALSHEYEVRNVGSDVPDEWLA